MNKNIRYKLIACEILYREICYCVSRCRNVVDVTFLPKGLHDMGEKKMSACLQEEIDKVDQSKYNALLLGYGLCNNGIRGLRFPLLTVIPRAHDCITLLMGSKEKYTTYFQEHPGTFFKSTGWVERDTDIATSTEHCMSQLGINRTYQQYVEQYGEENARYLMETMGIDSWLKNYKRLAYIDTGTGDFSHYKSLTKEEAVERGWEYDEVEGSLVLLQRMMAGEWAPADFCVISPQQTVVPSFDESVIAAK
jgi:hypothetical protein